MVFENEGASKSLNGAEHSDKGSNSFADECSRFSAAAAASGAGLTNITFGDEVALAAAAAG